jgi:hypothetical protein
LFHNVEIIDKVTTIIKYTNTAARITGEKISRVRLVRWRVMVGFI